MDKRIAELIGDISKVCVEINLNNNKDCVFLDIKGHVGEIEIDYCSNKERYTNKTFSDSLYYDYKDKEYVIKKLNKILNTLRKLNKNGKVNKKNFDYEIEEVKHYKFY